MANKQIFKTGNRVSSPAANTVNAAGGRAYRFSDEQALCQYVVTGTFSSVYYATGEEQLDKVQALAANAHNEFIAKAAIYGHEVAHMKDVPAFLLAFLAARGKTDSEALDYFKLAFPRVVTNAKMLCNFVQIVRSGVTGRRSFGTAVKRVIQNWLTSRKNDKLFIASIGHANPSLADIIKMVRPHPIDQAQEATFGYLLGKEYDDRRLPKVIKDFEAFKKDNSNELPDVPFRALTNCGLTTDHWKQIALNMPWNTLRMNLNTLERNGVFADQELTKQLAAKLGDADEVRKNNAFPYQLLTTFQNVSGVPMPIQLALQDAMEVATENVPTLETDVAVCIDLSGSMHSPVTGARPGGVQTKTTCVDVAALTAASLLRTNPMGIVVAWASNVMEVKVNPRDSVVTNSQKFARCGVGGGTSAQLGLRYLNKVMWKGDAVVYVSDNQSWLRQSGDKTSYWGVSDATEMLNEWNIYRKRNPRAKLVCIDIQPYGDTQVPDGSNCLNIGGFSDNVWPVIEQFIRKGDVDFVKAVKSVELK